MASLKQKQITLQGIITVDDFDLSGNPVRFVLLTDDERKYILEQDNNKNGIDISKYNRNKVQLTGEKRFDGKSNVLAVKDLKVIHCQGGNNYYL